MTTDLGQDEGPQRFEVGDRVEARGGIGGFLRPRVRSGTAGIVVDTTEGGGYVVQFVTGRQETVGAGDLLDAGA